MRDSPALIFSENINRSSTLYLNIFTKYLSILFKWVLSQIESSCDCA